MATNQVLVSKLYRDVIGDVINGVREEFRDEGVDETVLQKLKQNWEIKISASRAIDPVIYQALQSKLQQSQQSSSAATASASQASTSQAKQPAAATTPEASSATVLVPIRINVPPQPGRTAAKSIIVHVPPHTLQGVRAGVQLQAILSSPAVTAAFSLPIEMATTVLQQHISNALQTAARNQSKNEGVTQPDGPGDSSDEDNDDVEDDDMEVDENHDDDNNDENQNEEIPNSDDVTKDLFEADNVIVCQYDKITKRRRSWKLRLKDGIMNINGRDYVFGKASGDVEW